MSSLHHSGLSWLWCHCLNEGSVQAGWEPGTRSQTLNLRPGTILPNVLTSARSSGRLFWLILSIVHPASSLLHLIRAFLLLLYRQRFGGWQAGAAVQVAVLESDCSIVLGIRKHWLRELEASEALTSGEVLSSARCRSAAPFRSSQSRNQGSLYIGTPSSSSLLLEARVLRGDRPS